jgi:hypothetical protein
MAFHHALPPARLRADGLTYDRYPFRQASVRRGVPIPLAELADVDPTHIPPTIRTHAGELLFVPTEQKDELVVWARTVGLPLVAREDVWTWLLDPYLDVETGEAERAREYELLAELGFGRAEVDAIREDVGRAMNGYVAITWDWIYLGLWDVLMAKSTALLAPGELIRAAFGRRGGDPGSFYAAAMAIALRGPVKPYEPPAGDPP